MAMVLTIRAEWEAVVARVITEPAPVPFEDDRLQPKEKVTKITAMGLDHRIQAIVRTDEVHMNTSFEYIEATNAVVLRDDMAPRKIAFFDHAKVETSYDAVDALATKAVEHKYERPEGPSRRVRGQPNSWKARCSPTPLVLDFT